MNDNPNLLTEEQIQERFWKCVTSRTGFRKSFTEEEIVSDFMNSLTPAEKDALTQRALIEMVESEIESIINEKQGEQA